MNKETKKEIIFFSILFGSMILIAQVLAMTAPKPKFQHYLYCTRIPNGTIIKKTSFEFSCLFGWKYYFSNGVICYEPRLQEDSIACEQCNLGETNETPSCASIGVKYNE